MTIAANNKVSSEHAAPNMQAQGRSPSAKQHRKAVIIVILCRHMNVCSKQQAIVKRWLGVQEVSSFVCCLWMRSNRLSEAFLIASCNS